MHSYFLYLERYNVMHILLNFIHSSPFSFGWMAACAEQTDAINRNNNNSIQKLNFNCLPPQPRHFNTKVNFAASRWIKYKHAKQYIKTPLEVLWTFFYARITLGISLALSTRIGARMNRTIRVCSSMICEIPFEANAQSTAERFWYGLQPVRIQKALCFWLYHFRCCEIRCFISFITHFCCVMPESCYRSHPTIWVRAKTKIHRKTFCRVRARV